MSRVVMPMMCAGAMVVMLSAQGGNQAVVQGDVEGVVWVLTRFGPANSQVAPSAGSRLDLMFEQGRVSGSSGCNSYAGSYVLDGTALGIGGLASTRRACAPALMTQEDEYQKILRAVETVTLVGDRLTLSSPAGMLEFLAERELRLVGTWTLLGYNNGKGGVVSTSITSMITLTLDGTGRASGSSGCNTFTGAYKASGTAITIGPLASTRKMCADADIMSQEQLFLKALQAGTKIELRGDDLRLRNATGATQVHFRRQAPAK